MTELLLLLALLAPRDSLVVTWEPPAGVDSVQVVIESNWDGTGDRGWVFTVPMQPARWAWAVPFRERSAPIWVTLNKRVQGKWLYWAGDEITYTPPRRGLRLEIKRGDR